MKKIYFFFTVLAASNCINQRGPIPPIHQNKPNEVGSITIQSTGPYAMVCIGANNTMYIGKMGKKFECDIASKPLGDINMNDKNSILNHKYTLIFEKIPIKITETEADGAVVIGWNNNICRASRDKEEDDDDHDPKQRQ